MYTICYVLSDNEKLFYYNELLISLSSLRLHMPSQEVCVFLDNQTDEILRHAKREELGKEFNVATKVVTIDCTYSQKERSRYLKLKTRELIAGTILYLDTDTVLADKLPEELSESDLAMVEDLHVNLQERLDFESLKSLNQKYQYSLDSDTFPYYFNSGVIWAKETTRTREFFHQWFDEWDTKRSIAIFDQPALNYVNRKMGGIIACLDHRYNLQISAIPTPIQYLSDAVVIHYLNVMESGPYLLSDRNYLSLPYDSLEIRQIVKAPKSAFKRCRLEETDTDREVIARSWNYRALVAFYHHFPKLFHLTDRLLSRLRK